MERKGILTWLQLVKKACFSNAIALCKDAAPVPPRSEHVIITLFSKPN
jgi:hypothetical protein